MRAAGSVPDRFEPGARPVARGVASRSGWAAGAVGRPQCVPLLWFGVVLVAVLATAPRAQASVPALPLPAWVKVDVACATPPQLGVPEKLTVKVEALLAALPSSTYEVTLPKEVSAISGLTTGTVDLTPGKPVTLVLPIKVIAPVVGAVIAVELTTRPPRGALLKAIDQKYASDPAAKAAGARLVEKMPPLIADQEILGFTTTPEQAFFASSPDPVFLRVVKAPGTDLQFLLLDAIMGVDLGVIRKRMEAVVPQVEVMRRLAVGNAAKVLGPRLSELMLEATKLRYEEALLLLDRGEAKGALTLLESADVHTPGLPPTLEVGRELAVAVAQALSGDRAKAQDQISALASRPGLGALARYVYFASGELHRIAGETVQAREAYTRAAIFNPSFTLAHQRLETLH